MNDPDQAVDEQQSRARAAELTRAHRSDQLSSVSGNTVMDADVADVGQQREHARRGRLWRLAALIAVPTALMWYRILEHRPFNVFALPAH